MPSPQHSNTATKYISSRVTTNHLFTIPETERSALERVTRVKYISSRVIANHLFTIPETEKSALEKALVAGSAAMLEKLFVCS